MPYKLAILVRSDLKMSRGKVLAQTGHAMVDATVKAYTGTTIFYKWQADGEKIVVLKVPNEKTLDTIIEIANRKNIKNGIVVDAGLTEVAPGSKTVGYVGPATEVKIDKLVSQLKLY
mgnify:FL=1|jgi:PTH2 family peptidyl-tRNA hydrolase|tara:strand:- start:20714 stop:21064 length:351 start_codon:yes stop_codon:yes gene_type:complete